MPEQEAPSNLSRQAVGMRDYAATPGEYQPLSIQERIADRIYGGGMQAREGMQGIAEGRPWEAYKIPLGGIEALFSPISATAERGGEAIATSGRAGLPQLIAGALAQGTGEVIGGGMFNKLFGLGSRGLSAAGEAAKRIKGPYSRGINRKAAAPFKERRAPTRLSDEEFHANVSRAYGREPNPQGLTDVQAAARYTPPSGGVDLPSRKVDPLEKLASELAAREARGEAARKFIDRLAGPSPTGNEADFLARIGRLPHKPVPRGGLEGDLTRPWVGVKPAIGPQGGPLNVPKSYKNPKTYDLSEYE